VGFTHPTRRGSESSVPVSTLQTALTAAVARASQGTIPVRDGLPRKKAHTPGLVDPGVRRSPSLES
jgi:hypothetical protein